MTHNCTVSECTSLTVCVGEWSRRPRYSSTVICGRQVASTFVIRQWRSRVGRWVRQSLHSTAEQSTTTTTRPRRSKLPSRAVGPKTIMLQRTHITTLRSRTRWWVVVVSHYLAISCTRTNRLISAWVQLAMSLYNTSQSSVIVHSTSQLQQLINFTTDIQCCRHSNCCH